MRWFMCGGGIAWSWLLVLTLSCDQHLPKTPQGAYQAFYEAVLSGNGDEALAWLAKDYQDMFRRVGEQINRLVGEGGDGLAVFLKGARWDVQTPLRKVTILRQDPQGALLEVSAGDCRPNQPCSLSQVRMSRLAERWVIVPEVPEIMKSNH